MRWDWPLPWRSGARSARPRPTRSCFGGARRIERLADIRAVRFDKTGTLTTGSAVVQCCEVEHPDDSQDVLARAAALAASSSHALSHAITDYHASRVGGSPSPTQQVRVVAGRGVVGTLKGEDSEIPVSLGSALLMEERGLRLGPVVRTVADRAHDEGLSMAMVGWDNQTRGLFVFSERWRAGISGVIAWLRAAGLDVAILTGDHGSRGGAIAREFGVNVQADLLPDQKVEAICRARRELGPVAMVGDGVNDAPALAASDVGIALGCGTDVSRDSAAICLLGNDLTRIPWTIELARRTVRVIRRNLFWAFGYNILGVIAAALGWLNPAVAALLMVGSSAVVIGNSLRLRQPFSLTCNENPGWLREGEPPGEPIGMPAPQELRPPRIINCCLKRHVHERAAVGLPGRRSWLCALRGDVRRLRALDRPGGPEPAREPEASDHLHIRAAFPLTLFLGLPPAMRGYGFRGRPEP